MSAAVTANGTSTKISSPGMDDDKVIWKGDAAAAASKRPAAGSDSIQWTLNNDRIFDAKSGSTWEIADEILKLQISGEGAAAKEKTDKSSTANTSPSGKGSTTALAPAIDLDKPSAPRQPSADGDDVSSSDSSSLATPAKSTMPTSKIANGHQKKKEPYAPNGAVNHYPQFDDSMYPGSLMGAPGVQHYGVPSGAPLPSPLMSGFPHHLQTMHGPVPPPMFSPHQMPHQPTMLDGSLASGPRPSNGQVASYPPVHDASLQHPLSPFPRPAYPGSPPPATFSNPMSPTLSPTTYIGHPYTPAIHPSLNFPYGAPQMATAQSPGYEYLAGAAIDDPRNLANRSQFRGHQHSASDTAALRDPSDPSGINGSPYSPHSGTPYQSFYAAIPPPMTPISHSQGSQDVINALSRMSPYSASGAPAAYMAAIAAGVTDPAALALVHSGAGPSANNRKLGLYKTELCRSWEEKGSCRYGAKCQFAHGEDEIRKVSRHPKYKTEICRTFWVSGSCPYGKRCCFIHTELPAAGAPGAPAPGDGQRPGSTGASGVTPAPAPANGTASQTTDGRARSMSTNSDPNDAPSSLLARISAKAQANNAAAAQAANRSSEASPANGSSYNQDKVTANAIAQAYAQYGRPASGALLPGGTDNAPAVPDTFPTTNGNIGGHSGPSLGHRVSASVDFSGHRAMADFSSQDLSGGLGHQRNPSASAIHPQFGQLMNSRVGQTGVRATGEPNLSGTRNGSGQGSRFSHERSQSGGISRTVGSTFSTWGS